MTKKIVSIVLGSYNRLNFLRLTLETIRRELDTVDHEIIIVDGGSDDGTLAWLIQQKDVITIVQHNRGQWHGRPIKRRSWGYFMNLAFKAAQGIYVCMLSDDCLVVPGAIKNGIALFDRYRSERRNVGALAFYWRDWSRDVDYHVGHTLSDKLYVNHGIFLNDALKDIDYIDEETYFFYSADGDLCLKLWHKGYEVLESPDSYIEHYPHANVDVRKTNYGLVKQDTKNYYTKWTSIFYDSVAHNIGHIAYKKFTDPHNTALLFKSGHELVAQRFPALFQKPSMWRRGYKKINLIASSCVRKIRSMICCVLVLNIWW